MSFSLFILSPFFTFASICFYYQFIISSSITHLFLFILQALYAAFPSVLLFSTRTPIQLTDYTPPRQLRSLHRQLLSQPADNTVFTSRSFSLTIPRINTSETFG